MKQSALLIVTLLASQALQAEEKYSEDYQQCIDNSQGVTTNMLSCIGTELEKQDKKLNENYKALKANLTTERQQELLEVQRLWLKFRDANCKFYYDPEGGSMHRVMSSDCMLTMTAERAQELADLNNL